MVGAAVSSRTEGVRARPADRAARLRVARGVLSSVTGEPAEGEKVLEVTGALRPAFPGGGLRRGSTVAVASSGSLLLALLAEASAGGSWCALVGFPELGLVAAEEAGLVLSRVALVPHPGSDLIAVIAALLDGMDLVAVAGTQRLRAGDRQRLAARARQRGAVLCPVGPWPGADLEVSAAGEGWQGLVGGGQGRLRSRRVRVRVGGRGAAHRGRAVSVLLPGPDGAIAAAREIAATPKPELVREAG